MPRCPSCRSRQPREAVFCDRCGAPLGAPCPACGVANRPSARYCRACGLVLEAEPGGAAAPAPARRPLTSREAEGERKQVTVLFADMKGSMELLTERDPEEARAILDPVLERLLEAVHHYGGTVNQVLGDGIMALFGAPVACEDHAVRACLAALRMQEAVRHYTRERAAAARVAIRVGLNSGEVVVRALRGDVRLDYTAVGHTTHLAARMEQLAAPGTVLATAATAQLAEGYVTLVPRGEAAVKGLVQPVQVFEITGRGPLRSRLDAAAARGLTPFVGRRDELERLSAAWARAAAGQGQVVALVGEAGVGKSRLVGEFLRGVRAQGAAILTSDPVTWETPVPYAWAADLLRRHFELDRAQDASATRERVTHVAGQPDLEPLVPAFLALLDALPAGSPFHALEPRRRRSLLHRAIAQFVVEQSRAGGAVAVFENVHAMDAGSQAALDEVAERIAKERVLLIVTARPGGADRWIGRRASERLALTSLAGGEAEALLDALLGTAPELGPLRSALVSRTEGNPFFLEECVRALVQRGSLTGVPGAFRPVGTPAGDLPSTVQATVAARIDRLPPVDKHVLQSAAVVGRDFPRSLVAAITDLPAERVERALAELEAAALVDLAGAPPEAEYRFTHGLVHEVAYESVLHERRRLLHARLVEVMEANPAAAPVEPLAHHAWQGGLWAKAAVYLRRAGGRAAAQAANVEAVTFFERALDALGRLPESRETLEQAVDVRIELRPVLLQLGRLDAVLARSLEAERLAHALGDDRRLAAVYSFLVNYHYLKGEPEIALGYGERCLALAERAGDLILRTQAARYMAQIHHTLGEYGRARELFAANVETLAAVAAEADTQLGIAHVSSAAWLAFTLAELGEFAAAHRAAAEAERAAGTGRHAYGQAIAGTLRGLVWLRQGLAEQALEPLGRSLQACRERELTVWEPVAASLLGLALARLGRTDEARPLLEAGVSLSEGLGIAAYLALWTLHLAEGHRLAGDLEQATRTAQHALDLAIRHRERGHEAWALWLRGEIAAAGGTPPPGGAEAAYRRALDLAAALAMRPLRAHAHLGLGALLKRAGRRAEAEDHLVQALALFCEMDMRPWVRAACEALASLGRTLVVARHRAALHPYLDAVAGSVGGVRVILDRRQGERRRLRLPPERERRSGERRQAEIARRLAQHGLAVVA